MGNIEKNTFVREAITNTTILLLKEKDLEKISISEIVSSAQVSRNSFYRNYSDKEDILRQRVAFLLGKWNNEHQNVTSISKIYGDLFEHLKQNSDFYLLLKQKNLFYLFQQEYLHFFGPKPESDNTWAYAISFIAHGTLGWIEEWIGRGMQESADSMAKLLAERGML